MSALAQAGHEAEPTLADALSPVWTSRYRLRLRPREPLVLPQWGRGAILRGALGLSFRGLVCHDMSLDCRACPLNGDCPYPGVFEAAPPPDSERLRNFSDIPRPFVIDPPQDVRAIFSPHDVVSFGLTLVGRATRHLPYFVSAWQRLADDGIGPRRARFALEAVEALDAAGMPIGVYEHGQAWMTPVTPPVRARDLMDPSDIARSGLTIRYMTPMDLKDNGRAIAKPDFGPLLRRLRDRAAALAAFFGDGPLQLDFKELGAAADTVRLVEDRTRRLAIARPSSRTGRQHDIGGFAGEACYEGAAIGALMPLVRLGEVIHAGKHAAFGNGRFEVVDSARTR